MRMTDVADTGEVVSALNAKPLLKEIREEYKNE
jgi:hypothetical protein